MCLVQVTLHSLDNMNVLILYNIGWFKLELSIRANPAHMGWPVVGCQKNGTGPVGPFFIRVELFVTQPTLLWVDE